MTSTERRPKTSATRREVPAGEPGPTLGPASTILKAVSLMHILYKIDDAAGLTDLAVAADLPKSTTHRLLKALVSESLVERCGNKYAMGSRLMEFGDAVWRREYEWVRERSIPVLEWLFERSRSTVHLAVLEGSEVLYLEKITSRGGCHIPSRVGGRNPATCTALGKAMLATTAAEHPEIALSMPLARRTEHSILSRGALVRELQEARTCGIARDRQESRLGIHCIAAAVSTHELPIVAISIAGPDERYASDLYSPLIREGAVRLGRALNGRHRRDSEIA